MITINLCRYESNDQGTFGILYCNDFWLHSLELPWKNNIPDISCIPAGEYQVSLRYSPSFRKYTYWVRNVRNRNYVLIHSANFAGSVEDGWQSHLQGCITLGKVRCAAKNKFGNIQQCVSRSREAIRSFEDFLNKEDFKLVIKDCFYVDNNN
jgi:hypothetical protein